MYWINDQTGVSYRQESYAPSGYKDKDYIWPALTDLNTSACLVVCVVERHGQEVSIVEEDGAWLVKLGDRLLGVGPSKQHALVDALEAEARGTKDMTGTTFGKFFNNVKQLRENPGDLENAPEYLFLSQVIQGLEKWDNGYVSFVPREVLVKIALFELDFESLKWRWERDGEKCKAQITEMAEGVVEIVGNLCKKVMADGMPSEFAVHLVGKLFESLFPSGSVETLG